MIFPRICRANLAGSTVIDVFLESHVAYVR